MWNAPSILIGLAMQVVFVLTIWALFPTKRLTITPRPGGLDGVLQTRLLNAMTVSEKTVPDIRGVALESEQESEGDTMSRLVLQTAAGDMPLGGWSNLPKKRMYETFSRGLETAACTASL